MNDLITYETLFDILQKEKSRKELQKLENDFYQKCIRYLEEKTLILNSQKSKDSIFSSEIKKTEKQIENTKRIMKDLYERRERKIIESSLFSSRSGKLSTMTKTAMLSEEYLFYKDLKRSLNKYRLCVLSNLLEGKNPELKTKELKSDNNQNVLLKFTSSVPKFVWLDNIIYGPFEKEDIANLPDKIARILISKNRAEILSIK